MKKTTRDVSQRASLLKRRKQLAESSSGKRGQRPLPLKFAVVGLGHVAQTAVLPAFKNVEGIAEITALVSDDPVKLTVLSKAYPVARTYDHNSFDECLDSGIDAVYIALPNDVHREYAIRAAQAGIHVLCEKPMALTVADGQQMVMAAQDAGVFLMIAYRLHFDPGTLRAVEIANSGEIGEVRYFQSSLSMQVAAGGYRVNAAHGGGPLCDIGIYCINAARCLFRDEPTEVFAMAGNSQDRRFTDIDEMVSVMLRFPHDRHALFTASFGADPTSSYQVVGTKGSLCVDAAYAPNTSPCLYLTRKGRTKMIAFKNHDQFAAELRYFSQCIRSGKKPEPSGEEGIRDLTVINAIEESIRTGKRIALNSERRRDAYPGKTQKIQLHRAVAARTLVHTHGVTRG